MEKLNDVIEETISRHHEFFGTTKEAELTEDIVKAIGEEKQEFEKLFNMVDQLIKNSQPAEGIGIVVKSLAVWQALLNAWQYYKAEGH